MKTNVIIIGAGPSGLASAKVLSDAGIDTIVLEKRAQNSTKNFTSGVISKDTYEDIFGKITSFERTISEHRAYILNEDSFTSINTRNKKENTFTVLRTAFNNMLAKTVETAGVPVIFNKLVRELIVENGKVCGVRLDNNEEFFSDVVIIAEGANSLLVKKSGLRTGEFLPNQVFLFVEENIALPARTIEERFNLKSGYGISAKLFAKSFFKMPSMSYIHTNKNSILLGTGILLSALISKTLKEININQCQELIKNHPAVEPLIAGGVTTGYSSYTLPIAGYELQKYCVNGCLVVGGAGMLINPLDWDISSLAVLSGKLVAQTVIKAKELNDYSEGVLASYENSVKEMPQYKELKKQNLSKSFYSESLDNLKTLVLEK